MRVGSKILTATVISLTVVFITSVGSAYYVIKDRLTEDAKVRVISHRNSFQGRIEQLEKRAKDIAYVLSIRPDIIAAIESKNSTILSKIAQEVKKETGIGVLTIAGSDGIVLARGHSNKRGDSVLRQDNVKKALSGMSSMGIEEGTEIKLSIRVGMPVFKDTGAKEGDSSVSGGRTVVGSITTGFPLIDNVFVDQFKKEFDCEATIFQGNMRVDTTVKKPDGSRAIGTVQDKQEIVNSVLKEGKEYSATAPVLGKPYQTVYWPIKKDDGSTSGMFFVGVSLENVATITKAIVIRTSMLGGLIMLLAIGVMYSISSKISSQLITLAKAATSLSKGDIDTATELMQIKKR